MRAVWTFEVGSGAHVLMNGLLDVTCEMAEGLQRRALLRSRLDDRRFTKTS